MHLRIQACQQLLAPKWKSCMYSLVQCLCSLLSSRSVSSVIHKLTDTYVNATIHTSGADKNVAAKMAVWKSQRTVQPCHDTKHSIYHELHVHLNTVHSDQNSPFSGNSAYWYNEVHVDALVIITKIHNTYAFEKLNSFNLHSAHWSWSVEKSTQKTRWQA